MITISERGPTLSEDDVKAFESDVGVTLPADYRAFLLANNGGRPTPDTIDIPSLEGSPTDVQIFFGIDRRVKSSDLSWNLKIFVEQWRGHSALPIACDSGGNLFCLRIRGGRAAEVLYYPLGAINYTPDLVAPAFKNFLDRLRPLEH